MNYGLREGFGPVLLDYPYVFELDGRKLICNVPEPFQPNGYCGGEIDYDIGYNNLICTKCGKRYLATELKTDERSDKPKIIVKGEDMIMKCVLRRGDEIVSKLNSEDHVATNTIRPRKDFSRLKATVVRPTPTEDKKDIYRPNARTRDEVQLQAVVKGNRRSEDIDAKARKQQEIIDKNTPKIPVSYGNELFNFSNTHPVAYGNESFGFDNIHQMKEESKLEVNITKPVAKEEIPETSTVRSEITLSPEPVVEEEKKEELAIDIIDVDGTPVDLHSGESEVKEEDKSVIKVRIEDEVIYSVESNEVIGYTPMWYTMQWNIAINSNNNTLEVLDGETENTVEEVTEEPEMDSKVEEAVNVIAEAVGQSFEPIEEEINEEVTDTTEEQSELEEDSNEEETEVEEVTEEAVYTDPEPCINTLAENPAFRQFAQSLEEKVEKEKSQEVIKKNKFENRNNNFSQRNERRGKGVTVKNVVTPVNPLYSSQNRDKRRQMEAARNNY